jgi:hypothetical protein
VFIILFTEVVVSPEKAPASTTTKAVVAVPIFDGGSIVTAPPEIVTLEEETPMVENAVPLALPDLKVILPVPVVTPTLKVMIMLEFRLTPVAPIAGLNTMGTGGTFIEVAVRTPTVIVSLTIFAVFAIPVRFAPLPLKEVAVTTPDALRLVAAIVPTVILGVPERPKEVVAKETDEIPVRFAPLPLKEVAVTTPTKLAPALTFPTSCTLVTDILLLLFSYLSSKEVKVHIHSTLIISTSSAVMRY